MQTKRCSRCEEHLPVSMFYYAKGAKAYSAQCRPCTSLTRKENYVKRMDRPGPRATPLCRCGETDPNKFYKNAGAFSGYQWQCKKCATIYKGRKPKPTREETLARIRAQFRHWCESGEFK